MVLSAPDALEDVVVALARPMRHFDLLWGLIVSVGIGNRQSSKAFVYSTDAKNRTAWGILWPEDWEKRELKDKREDFASIRIDYGDIRDITDFVPYEELLLANEELLRKQGKNLLGWYEKHLVVNPEKLLGLTIPQFNEAHLKIAKKDTLGEIKTQQLHSKQWLKCAIKESDNLFARNR